MALTACATTPEEREAYRETGMLLALTAVDVIRDVGLGPEEVDPKVLKIVNGACTLMKAGGPLIVLAINTRVSEANAEAAEDEQTGLVTAEEYLATLDAVCVLIEAILTPEEVPPEPEAS